MTDKFSPLLARLVIFTVSFLAICLELFFTRVLNLKTFNHIVYVVIPFAILGYGIGANIYLLAAEKLRTTCGRRIVAVATFLFAGTILLSYYAIVRFPIGVHVLENFFQDGTSGLMLSAMYFLILLPFVLIGFMILYLFSREPENSPQLYFWDLLGSGAGAVGFFFLINILQVSNSLIFISVVVFSLGVLVAGGLSRWCRWTALGLLVAGLVLTGGVLPEVRHYATDTKGWENFPEKYSDDEYEWVSSRWHPLGRTDLFRLNDRKLEEAWQRRAAGTFQIDLLPFPEFTYFSSNLIAGTPAYHLAPEGLARHHSELRPFVVAMEFPYILLSEPQVVVIGAGGGRDIFLAKSHGASRVIGAEINPGIVREMSPGGLLHEYTGKIYTAPGVTVENVDGRQLVKRLPPGQTDLIVLNGVDTYSGLSSGAYAFAESYLYTKEAVVDYLRLLKPGGMINFNRWLFEDQPRETLRLFVIVLEALRETGVDNPWEHVIVGAHQGWGLVLVKRTPFTTSEQAAIALYFKEHYTTSLYPSPALAGGDSSNFNAFDRYAVALAQGQAREFIDQYPFDISVVTDDDPFFYKYYRWQDFRMDRIGKFAIWGSGLMIFMTQALVLCNGLLFSLLFLLLPLWLLRRRGLTRFKGRRLLSFLTYFPCLGAGFMLIEIPLMQKFSMLLGSPIHAISVILGTLLIASGVGSYCVNALEEKLSVRGRSWSAVGLVILLTAALVFGSKGFTNAFVGLSFPARLLAVVLAVFPLGFCLGTFFPSGLRLVGTEQNEAVAWAWGINCGFSVLGAMLSVILAQFFGFNAVLWLAAGIYILAGFSFDRLAR